MFKVDVIKKPPRLKKPIPLKVDRNKISLSSDECYITDLTPKAVNDTKAQDVSAIENNCEQSTDIMFEIY